MQAVCFRLGCAVCALAAAATSPAAPSVCGEPARVSFVSVDLVNHERSFIDGSSASSNQETRDFRLHFVRKSGRFTWGVAHRYLIFDFSGIEPQTNGHVHTTFAPLHWRPGDRGLRISLAPAVSASSNVMGHPRKWDSQTPQLLAALVATVRVSDALDFRYGVCGDHRFGEYAVYPAAAVFWRPGPGWNVELGFPVTALSFEPFDALRSTLAIGPDGNEWHVMDRDLIAESRLVYEAIALEWTTEWRAHASFALTISLGRQLDNRYEMTLAEGQHVSVRGEAANRFGLGFRWTF